MTAGGTFPFESAAERTLYVPVVGDIGGYMPTQPVVRAYRPKYPRFARFTRWLSATVYMALVYGVVVAFVAAAVFLGLAVDL